MIIYCVVSKWVIRRDFENINMHAIIQNRLVSSRVCQTQTHNAPAALPEAYCAVVSKLVNDHCSLSVLVWYSNRLIKHHRIHPLSYSILFRSTKLLFLLL